VFALPVLIFQSASNAVFSKWFTYDESSSNGKGYVTISLYLTDHSVDNINEISSAVLVVGNTEYFSDDTKWNRESLINSRNNYSAESILKKFSFRNTPDQKYKSFKIKFVDTKGKEHTITHYPLFV
jgi:hypothetical protein